MISCARSKRNDSPNASFSSDAENGVRSVRLENSGDPLEFKQVTLCTKELCLEDIIAAEEYQVLNILDDQNATLKISTCKMNPIEPRLATAQCVEDKKEEGLKLSGQRSLDFGHLENYMVKTDISEAADLMLMMSSQFVRQQNTCTDEDYKRFGLPDLGDFKNDINQEFRRAEQRVKSPRDFIAKVFAQVSQEKSGFFLDDIDRDPARNFGSKYGIQTGESYKVVTSYYRPILDIELNASSVAVAVAAMIPGTTLSKEAADSGQEINKVTKDHVKDVLKFVHGGAAATIATDNIAKALNEFHAGKKSSEDFKKVILDSISGASKVMGRAGGFAGESAAQQAGDGIGGPVEFSRQGSDTDTKRLLSSDDLPNIEGKRPLVRRVRDGLASNKVQIVQASKKGVAGAVSAGTVLGAGAAVSVASTLENLEDIHARARTGVRAKQGGNIKFDTLAVAGSAASAGILGNPAAMANLIFEGLNKAYSTSQLALGNSSTVLYEVFEVDSDKPIHSFTYPPSHQTPGTGTRAEMDALYDNKATKRVKRLETFSGGEYLQRMDNLIRAGRLENVKTMLEIQGLRAEHAKIKNKLEASLGANLSEDGIETMKKKLSAFLNVSTFGVENIKINGEIPSFEYGAYSLKVAMVQEARKEGYVFERLRSAEVREAVAVPKDVEHLKRLNQLMDEKLLPEMAKFSKLHKNETIAAAQVLASQVGQINNAKKDLDFLISSGRNYHQLVNEFHPVNAFGYDLNKGRIEKTIKCATNICSTIELLANPSVDRDLLNKIDAKKASPSKIIKAVISAEQDKRQVMAKSDIFETEDFKTFTNSSTSREIKVRAENRYIAATATLPIPFVKTLSNAAKGSIAASKRQFAAGSSTQEVDFEDPAVQNKNAPAPVQVKPPPNVPTTVTPTKVKTKVSRIFRMAENGLIDQPSIEEKEILCGTHPVVFLRWLEDFELRLNYLSSELKLLETFGSTTYPLK